MIPKAELHVHINGTISSKMLPELAERNGVTLSDAYFDPDGNARWVDYTDFHEAYSAGSAAVKTPKDFADVAYDYLRRCHEEGAIYVELMASPDKSKRGGSSFDANLNGIIDGIERAKKDFGIESRIVLTAKRHRGAEDAWTMLREARKSLQSDRVKHYLTGFGLAGDETQHRAIEFKTAFEFARNELGLECTVHAGEALGAAGVEEVVNNLPIKRIGHGVRAVDDPELVKEIAKKGIVLEVCPTSNVVLKFFRDFASHPMNALRAAGVKVTINSDDPSLFGTSIGREYEIAEKHFGIKPEQQLEITRTAIEAGFMDDVTRQRLLTRVDVAMKNLKAGKPLDQIDEGPVNDDQPPAPGKAAGLGGRIERLWRPGSKGQQ
jgi:adenosine deaminase